MTRNEVVVSLVSRVKSGDIESIVAMLQCVTYAGWQTFGYSATAKSKAEYKGYGWVKGDIKILANYAKRTRYRTLSEKEVAFAQKRLPEYAEQVAELIAKPGYYDQVVAAFQPRS